jgi:hypothetical protein
LQRLEALTRLLGREMRDQFIQIRLVRRWAFGRSSR